MASREENISQNSGKDEKNDVKDQPNESGTNLTSQYSYNMYGQPEMQYKNMREYAQALHCWMFQYRMMAAFSSFQSQMLASVPHNRSFNHAHSLPSQTNGNVTNGFQQTGSVPVNPNNEGTQYKIPMLWRRVVAEFLDFVLLFYTKILVTMAVLKQMGYMEENLLEFEAQFPAFLTEYGELDYDKVFSLTSELIALEVVNRLCITLVEAMCLRRGYAGAVGGATPGKKIMQLKVVSFTEIRDARNGHVVVVGARNPGFINALIRSIIKNFSLAFFFPACFTAFFFRFNRAAYDVLAQTVVVEVENRHHEH